MKRVDDDWMQMSTRDSFSRDSTEQHRILAETSFWEFPCWSQHSMTVTVNDQ